MQRKRRWKNLIGLFLVLYIGNVSIVQADKVDDLIEQLKSREQSNRYIAARSLGMLKDTRVVEPLIVTLKDEDEMVRKEASEALDKLGWEPKSDEEKAYYLVAKRDWEKVISLGTLSVAPLFHALKHVKFYPYDHSPIAASLVKIGKPTVLLLIKALDDKDSKATMAAAWVLGEIGDTEAVESLINVLKDDPFNIYCIMALGKIGKPAVLPLIELLSDKNPSVRMASARTLSIIKDTREAVEPLLNALEDENTYVRADAAMALGNTRDARAVKPLINLLKDGSTEVRVKAAGALGEIGDRQAVLPLITLLKDEDSEVREEAAEELGKIGDVRAVESLITALNDKARNVRYEVAEALGKIGDIRAVEPLIRAIEDKDWGIRRQVVVALEKIGGSRAVEPLINALKDRHEAVRERAAESLGKIGTPEAVIPLINALWDDSERVQGMSEWALNQITGKYFGQDVEVWQKWWEQNKKNFPIDK